MSNSASMTRRIAAMPAYSFKADPAVPAYDATRPLIVFDGVCVLCSQSMRRIARFDLRGTIQFTAAQSPLGRALFRHYGVDPEQFETFLLIADGRATAKLDAVAAVARLLRWPWRAVAACAVLPLPAGDWLYDRIAKNRYTVFGRTDTCFIPDPSWRARVIE